MPFLQFTLDIGSRSPEPYEEALFALGVVLTMFSLAAVGLYTLRAKAG